MQPTRLLEEVCSAEEPVDRVRSIVRAQTLPKDLAPKARFSSVEVHTPLAMHKDQYTIFPGLHKADVWTGHAALPQGDPVRCVSPFVPCSAPCTWCRLDLVHEFLNIVQPGGSGVLCVTSATLRIAATP